MAGLRVLNFYARVVICVGISTLAAEALTYGLYAGDIDWDKAVEAMAKVSYGSGN